MLIFLILLTIFFIYSYIIINKKYFVISNSNQNIFYIVPKDKEGEKVNYTDKKSLNEHAILTKDINNLYDIENLSYTIQLFSHINLPDIEIYLKNLLYLKSQILNKSDLFVFSITTQIGTEYFLTYKNFNTKKEALKYCKTLTFVKNCTILNLTNQ